MSEAKKLEPLPVLGWCCLGSGKKEPENMHTPECQYSQPSEGEAMSEAESISEEVLARLTHLVAEAWKLGNQNAQAEVARLRESGDILQNLLAVIHRDGGHYTAAHGLKKSEEDAEKIVTELRAEVARLREALEKIANQTEDGGDGPEFTAKQIAQAALSGAPSTRNSSVNTTTLLGGGVQDHSKQAEIVGGRWAGCGDAGTIGAEKPGVTAENADKSNILRSDNEQPVNLSVPRSRNDTN